MGQRIPLGASARHARRGHTARPARQSAQQGYVSNILSKLYLADRTQAAVFAWREGMMRTD